MVGLPGAGKTTLARQLAAERRILRLTPDDRMAPLCDRFLALFQPPTAEEPAGGPLPAPPAGSASWPQWASGRWPTLPRLDLRQG